MADGPAETVQVVPDWAVKIVQAAIREYRYTGDYLPGTHPEKVVIGVRRGDRALGAVTLTHGQSGDRHFLRLQFESEDRAAHELLTARSLKMLQGYAPLLLERVCRHGCALDPHWCDDCSQAARHAKGEFRGVTPGPAPAP